MAVVIQQFGLEVYLYDIIGGFGDAGTLSLFTNDVTPTNTDDASVYTLAGGSLAAADVSPFYAPTFTDDGGGTVHATCNDVTFTFDGTGGPINVYGWTFQTLAGEQMASKRFSDGPYVFATAGDRITISLTFAMNDSST